MGRRRKKRLIPLIVTILVMMFICAGCGQEEALAGRIIKALQFDGEVSYLREGVSADVYTNQNFMPEDEVNTGADGNLMMQADTDKYIYLYENTTVTLNYEGNETDGKTYITLKTGEIYNEIQNSLTEDSEYEIRTSNATIAVRGTQFFVGSDVERSIVYCTDGLVKITTAKETLEIKKDEGAIIEDDVIRTATKDEIEAILNLQAPDTAIYSASAAAASASYVERFPATQFAHYIHSGDDTVVSQEKSGYDPAVGYETQTTVYDGVDGEYTEILKYHDGQFLSSERYEQGVLTYYADYAYDATTGQFAGYYAYRADGTLMISMEAMEYHDNGNPSLLHVIDYGKPRADGTPDEYDMNL